MTQSNQSLVKHITEARNGHYCHVIEVDSIEAIESIIDSVIEEHISNFSAQSIIDFFDTLEVIPYDTDNGKDVNKETETLIHDFDVNEAVTNVLSDSCDDLFRVSEELDLNLEELTEEIIDSESNDFEINGYRFITSDSIDSIQQEELSNDLYILGCFNASFLSEVLEMDQELIELVQEAEKYEKLGEMVINNGKIEKLQEGYSFLDGYGHHFAHYDGEEIEETLNGTDYYIFRVN